MLANKMMEDSGNSKDSILNHTSEPHVVVACPSCKTKFAVESTLIAAYEIPKFHCSRCDNIFEVNHHSKHVKEPTPALINETNRWVLTDRANDDVIPGSDTPTDHRALLSNRTEQVSKPITPLKPSDFTLGLEASRIETTPPAQPQQERAGLSILGLRPLASRRSTTSLTRQEALSYAAPAGEERSISAGAFSLFDQPAAPPTQPITPPKAPEPIQATPPQQPPTSAQQNIRVTPRQAVTSTKADTAPKARLTSRLSGIKGAFLSLTTNFSQRNRGLARLTLPLLATLAGLTVIGYSARLIPETIGSTFEAVVPSVISGKISRLPPPELRVQELTLGVERTLSKESIAVVRGYVVNSGDKKIGDITIEALGFNRRGDVVVSAKAPLRSALAREKIADLPLATVKKFQTALSASTSTIAASEKVPFTIALIADGTAPGEIAYFSARIFSVGEIKN